MVEEQNTQNQRRSRGIFFPFLLILLGILFLANNFGLIAWNLWDELWKFWPVVLIAIGLNILMKGERK